MPKPLKKARRPKPPAKSKRSSDSKPAARAKVQDHMRRMAEGPMPDDFGTQLSTYMANLGRKGGTISGAKRMENLSERKRRQIAKKAAAARWGKKPS
jgi:hypothetical protein